MRKRSELMAEITGFLRALEATAGALAEKFEEMALHAARAAGREHEARAEVGEGGVDRLTAEGG